jgi:flavin-dependent dehydrogenase
MFSDTTSRSKSFQKLEDGSRIAVIGGGPAGSLFSYFLLDIAGRAGLDVQVDIYEPRDFSLPAPQGCNMCAGVISETLIQNLATEGIVLPASVIQKAINSYVLHTDRGSQRIEAAQHEKRIGAIFRGAGPRGVQEIKTHGFDEYLLFLAQKKGARLIRRRVTAVERVEDFLTLRTQDHPPERYDLLAIAAGVNTTLLKLFEKEVPEYRPPKTTKTALREYFLGKEVVDQHFGDSLHVFLLDIPGLDFAMIVPKSEYVSVCLLGKDIDAGSIQAFLTSSEVKRCFPDGWRWDQPVCQCAPRINIQTAIRPYANRVVFIGDSGVTRLYKDGLGAAYRSAKAAATCAVLQGISEEDFQRYYEPFCRKMHADNRFGKLIFGLTHVMKHVPFARKAILQMATDEQLSSDFPPSMSNVLWDTFTGSAPYRDVLLRILQPTFISRFVWSMARHGR